MPIFKCKLCQADVEVEEHPDVLYYAKKYGVACKACCDAGERERDEAARRESKAVREREWQQACPPVFRDSDMAKLPNKGAAERALAWNYCSNGLLMHGKSGSGKSRVAWMIAKREFISGKRIKAMDSDSGLKYAAQFGLGAMEASQWVQSRIGCDLLLMDDVFKSKLTDSYEAAVFSIINARTEALKPMIITVNDTGETLLKRMSEDRGEAILRRLREFCKAINF